MPTLPSDPFPLSYRQGTERTNWQPIEIAPRSRKARDPMFAVIAKDAPLPSNPNILHTTDPYYVFPDNQGGFARWPHSFPPTHWHPMPKFEPESNYRSHLYTSVNLPSVVVYQCLNTKEECGRVYKMENGKWFLSTVYCNNWQPFEVFTKYGGFLCLNEFHRVNQGR